jgi:hypothetical protein
MKSIAMFGMAALAGVVSAAAAGLPVPTATLQDFEYTTNPAILSYSPGGAPVSLFTSFILLYGTPAGGGGPRKLELIDVANADACFSTTCPSTTTAYPQPNYVLTVGELLFTPNGIVAGTGVNSLNTDFPLTGNINSIGGPPPGFNINADGMPVLFTGDDPGGLSSYAYFRNADGTVSTTLHVFSNTSGGAFLSGVILDPPATLTLDILGFTNLQPNSFVTGTVPEPAAGLPVMASIAILGSYLRRRRTTAA